MGSQISKRDEMSEMDIEILKMRSHGRVASAESAKNLPLLQEVFQDVPKVSFLPVGSNIHINFHGLSGKAGDIVCPILSQKFPGADKNQISFYLLLMRPVDSPDFLKTILFVQNEQVRHCIYVDQWGYSQPLRFANIEEVIGEVRRMISLVY